MTKTVDHRGRGSSLDNAASTARSAGLQIWAGDLTTQHRENLTLHHPVAPLDTQSLDDADHRRADFGDRLGFDQACLWLRGAGRRRDLLRSLTT